MNKKSTRIIIFTVTLVMAAVLVVVDQVTKFYASQLPLGLRNPVINGFFYITYCRNTGAAWSMFTGKVSILAIISLVASFLIIFLLYCSRLKLVSASLGLILAGAVGNLIDRFSLGYVHDFLDFIIFGYDFPVFNVADMCVVIGAMLMVLTLIVSGKKTMFVFPWSKKQNAAEDNNKDQN